MIFAGACNGLFFGINRHNGNIIWQYDIRTDADQTGFHGNLLVTDNLVIVATDGRWDGFVYAIEQKSGKVRWKYDAHEPVPSDIVRYNQLVYALTRTDSLVALDLATGLEQWRFASPGVSQFDTFVSSPVIAGNTVVMAGRDGSIYALDVVSGQIVWKYEVGKSLMSPIQMEDLIYIGIVGENKVIAISAQSGELKAQMKLEGRSLVTYTNLVPSTWGLIVTKGDELELWSPDLKQLLWNAKVPADFARSPVVWNKWLLGGTVRGNVIRIHHNTGQTSLMVDVNDVVTGLAAFDGLLYIGTQEGTLHAVRP